MTESHLLATIAVAATLLTGTAVYADDILQIGENAVPNTDVTWSLKACPSIDIEERGINALRDRGFLDGMYFMIEHGCQKIDDDAVLPVRDLSPIHGMACVFIKKAPIPDNALDCYWLPKRALKPQGDKEAWQKQKEREQADANRQQADTKKMQDGFNAAFDREHPECKDFRTNTHLPEYCY